MAPLPLNTFALRDFAQGTTGRRRKRPAGAGVSTHCASSSQGPAGRFGLEIDEPIPRRAVDNHGICRIGYFQDPTGKGVGFENFISAFGLGNKLLGPQRLQCRRIERVLAGFELLELSLTCAHLFAFSLLDISL